MAYIPYRLVRSRRKTVSIQVLPRGEVVVRCPMKMSAAAVERLVESKSEWIAGQLAKCVAPEPMTEAEHQALIQRAKEQIPARAAWFASQLGVDYGRITIRSQHSRWGSCSAKGNLNFNCLLMLAPEAVADYVVVHELCHRIEMNHSPKFWEQVTRILPDYRIQRKWLKDNGPALMAKLPKIHEG